MSGSRTSILLLMSLTWNQTEMAGSRVASETTAEPASDLCDLHMWYLDQVADGIFDGDLSSEQQEMKKRIETLIARGRGTATSGRISCSTLITFENILLPDTSIKEPKGELGGVDSGDRDVREPPENNLKIADSAAVQASSEEETRSDDFDNQDGTGLRSKSKTESPEIIHGEMKADDSNSNENPSRDIEKAKSVHAGDFSGRANLEVTLLGNVEGQRKVQEQNDYTVEGQDFIDDREFGVKRQNANVDFPEIKVNQNNKDTSENTVLGSGYNKFHPKKETKMVGDDSNEVSTKAVDINYSETNIDGEDETDSAGSNHFKEDDDILDVTEEGKVDNDHNKDDTGDWIKPDQEALSLKELREIGWTEAVHKESICDDFTEKASCHTHPLNQYHAVSMRDDLGYDDATNNSKKAPLKSCAFSFPSVCTEEDRKVCNLSEHLFPWLSQSPQKHYHKPSLWNLNVRCKTPQSFKSKTRQIRNQCSNAYCYYQIIMGLRKRTSPKAKVVQMPAFQMIEKSCRFPRQCTSRCFYGRHKQQCMLYYDTYSAQSQQTDKFSAKEANQETKSKQHVINQMELDDVERTQNVIDKNDNHVLIKERLEYDGSDNIKREIDESKGKENIDGNADDNGNVNTSSDGQQSDFKAQDGEEDKPEFEFLSEAGHEGKNHRCHKAVIGDKVVEKTPSEDRNHEKSKKSELTKEDLLKIEVLYQQKTSEQETKIHSLEILLMKLENQILAQRLSNQNGSSQIVQLENHILRIENELLKLNHSHAALQQENEVLKARQHKHLALEHKSKEMNDGRLALPTNSSKYFELVTVQQEKLGVLEELLKNQTRHLDQLQLRSDKLEEQNQLLHQIILNQSAVISQIMHKLQEVSEKNSQHSQDTNQRKPSVDLQSPSHNIVHTLENPLDEVYPLVGTLSETKNIASRPQPEDTSPEKTFSEHQKQKFHFVLKFLPVNTELASVIEAWECGSKMRPELCLLFNIILRPCPPFRPVSWVKCQHLMNFSEHFQGMQSLQPGDPETVLENRDILNIHGAFSGASSENIRAATRVMDTGPASDTAEPVMGTETQQASVRSGSVSASSGEGPPRKSSSQTTSFTIKDGSEEFFLAGSNTALKHEDATNPKLLKYVSSNKTEDRTQKSSPNEREAPDSVKIPTLKSSAFETQSVGQTEDKDKRRIEDKGPELFPITTPPSSQTLPTAVEVIDGQRSEIEMKRLANNKDLSDARNSHRILPEVVKATDIKKESAQEESKHSSSDRSKENHDSQERISTESTEKDKIAAADGRKKEVDENSKMVETKQIESEAERKRQLAESAKKLERQDQELMAQKVKTAEQRALLYWSVDSRKPKDCYDLYRRAPAQSRNGAYKVFIKGLNLYVSVFCDMKAGGWTLLMKRQDGSLDFYKGWDEYTEGFGTPFSEHYVGNEVIHYLTNQDQYSLQIDLKDWAGHTRSAIYEHFWLDSEQEKFKLHILGYSGTAGDGLGKHDGMKFSTKDQDNDLLAADQMGGSCSRRFHGAGWYYKCYTSNLMGAHYMNGVVPEKRFDGIAWKPWTGPSYSMKEVVLKVRPRGAK